eukprot:403361276
MGIQGLLPALKALQKEKHIREFKGKTIGVDGLCWMHQGAYQCARELMRDNPWQGLEKVIDYCVGKIKQLQINGITPIMVFDGARLPMKKRIEEQRKKAREDSRNLAEDLLAKGDQHQAIRKFMEAVEINSLMIYRLTQVLETMNVQFVVAPYEADAQLAHLFKTGKVDLIITEDSDLLVYGVTRVLFKMDPQGQGIYIDLNNLNQCDAFKMPQSNGGKVFDYDLLLKTCILNGCDYCESLKGVGFKTALKLMKEYNGDIRQIVESLRGKNIPIRQNYMQDFQRAELTFKYQVVFDMENKKQKYLNELPDNISDSIVIEYFGVVQEPQLAIQISACKVDPDSFKSFETIIQEKQALQEKQQRIESIRQIIEGYQPLQLLTRKESDANNNQKLSFGQKNKREEKFKIKQENHQFKIKTQNMLQKRKNSDQTNENNISNQDSIVELKHEREEYQTNSNNACGGIEINNLNRIGLYSQNTQMYQSQGKQDSLLMSQYYNTTMQYTNQSSNILPTKDSHNKSQYDCYKDQSAKYKTPKQFELLKHQENQSQINQVEEFMSISSEQNSIIPTLKKKSYLNSFLNNNLSSPYESRKRQNTNSFLNSAMTNQQDHLNQTPNNLTSLFDNQSNLANQNHFTKQSDFQVYDSINSRINQQTYQAYEERNPPKSPLRIIKENPKLYKLEKNTDNQQKQVSYGLKKALINNTNINQYFTSKNKHQQ